MVLGGRVTKSINLGQVTSSGDINPKQVTSTDINLKQDLSLIISFNLKPCNFEGGKSLDHSQVSP